VLPDVFQTGTDFTRALQSFSRQSKPNSSSTLTLVSVRPNAVAIYGPQVSHKPCEEKSVDVEKPESSGMTP
jgi:hypothetical protein